MFISRKVGSRIIQFIHQGCALQKQLPEVFCKKSVLRNFSKFTEKHLCESLFFNEVD